MIILVYHASKEAVDAINSKLIRRIVYTVQYIHADMQICDIQKYTWLYIREIIAVVSGVCTDGLRIWDKVVCIYLHTPPNPACTLY